MPGRDFTSNSYRYGYQGQEKDDEIKGNGASLNYEYRMHDPRLGRFLSVDPLSSSYPFYSPYAFSGNRVIDSREIEGLEPFQINNSEVDPLRVISVATQGDKFQQTIQPNGLDYINKNVPIGSILEPDNIGMMGAGMEVVGYGISLIPEVWLLARP